MHIYKIIFIITTFIYRNEFCKKYFSMIISLLYNKLRNYDFEQKS